MKTLIHVGIEHAGARDLQRHVFPALLGTAVVHSRAPVFRHLATNLCVAANGAYLPRTVAAYLDDVTHGYDRLLVSYEGFSGSVFLPHRHPALVADRLHDLVPDAHILVCIRNQRSLLGARYDDAIRRGADATVEEFLAGRVPDTWVDLDSLQYDALVAMYDDRFGPERVHVLTYEQLLSEPAAFAEDLATILGVGPTRCLPTLSGDRLLSRGARHVLRRINRSVRRTAHNPSAPVDLGLAHRARYALDRVDRSRFRVASRSFSDRDDQALSSATESYAASNARLAERTGLQLSRYGYIVGAPES